MSRLRSLLTALAVAAAAVLVTASPAAAHDELISSTPSSGERLASAPSEVTLAFSADVLTIGAAVIVVDGSGRDWAASAPTISDGVVTVELDSALPVGGFEIRWRVVSQDGHPISGLIPFTVGDAAPLERTPAATDATDAATGAAAAAPTDAAQQQSAQEDQGALRLVLVGIGGAIVAVAAYTLITLLRRKKGTPSP